MDMYCFENGYPISQAKLDVWWRALNSGCVLYLYGFPGLGMSDAVRALARLKKCLKYLATNRRQHSFCFHQSAKQGSTVRLSVID